MSDTSSTSSQPATADATTTGDLREQLRLKQAMLDETGRMARIGGWNIDPKTGLGEWSDEIARIFDVEPAHLTHGRQAFAFYTETSRPVIEQAVRDAIQQAQPYDLELEIISAAGVRKWVHTIGRPTVVDGVVVRIHGSVQDITDRKRAELRLATQNAISRIIAESPTIEAAVPRMLAALCEAERWDGGILFLVDEATGRLQSRGAWARPNTVGTALIGGVPRFTFERGEGLLGEVWASRVAALRPVAEFLGTPRDELAPVTLDAGYRTVLACPIDSGEAVLGVACFLSLDEKPNDAELRRACEAFGQQFALFIVRKQAEQALVQSEERYRTLVAEASDGIFLVGADSHYQEVNHRYAEMLGRPREEILGARIGAFLKADQRDVVPTIFEALRGTRSHVAEVRVQRGDGTIVELELSGRLLPDDSIIAIARDITQRKQTEAAVRRRLELEARLSQLATAAPGAMFTLRTGDDGVPFFPYASPQIEDVTGFTAEQLVADGRLVLDAVPDDDRPAVVASMRASAQTMSMWSLTFRHQHARKGLRWLDGRSMPVREADGALSWHGFIVDVTERRELEEQLRQAQKMEAIGQLASGVAHDFNNLLTVIQGNASMLADGGGHEGCAQEIMQAAERAADLTRQLLLFSRKQEMLAVDLDLNDVVANMSKLLRRIVGEDITLRADFSPRPAIIRADAGMIQQVLLNLAVNSRDAMPAGGRLTITTSLEETSDSAAESGLVARLQVTDTGSGIPSAVIARIFEPFFTTKDVGKGTGLGLATVYAIVRQHGGTIDVHSEAGHGTTFDIAFPAQQCARTDERVARRVEMPRGYETILVVEDEPAVRHLVEHLLTQNGYRVVSAESGQRALAIFAEHGHKIDLLLTDIVMPDGVSGHQLAQRLMAQRPDLKVIYTSGYMADAAVPDVSLIPGENFLAKPYPPADLARLVRAALDR